MKNKTVLILLATLIVLNMSITAVNALTNIQETGVIANTTVLSGTTSFNYTVQSLSGGNVTRTELYYRCGANSTWTLFNQTSSAISLNQSGFNFSWNTATTLTDCRLDINISATINSSTLGNGEEGNVSRIVIINVPINNTKIRNTLTVPTDQDLEEVSDDTTSKLFTVTATEQMDDVILVLNGVQYNMTRASSLLSASVTVTDRIPFGTYSWYVLQKETGSTEFIQSTSNTFIREKSGGGFAVANGQPVTPAGGSNKGLIILLIAGVGIYLWNKK